MRLARSIAEAHGAMLVLNTLVESLAVAEGGFYDVVLTSFNFTMADDDAMLSAIKTAAESGVGIIAMKTMAGRIIEQMEKLSIDTLLWPE